jgi:hypothetical protein
MILRSKRDGSTVPYEPKEAARLVHRLRDKLRLPATFTLDACRHGGMTELEEAELTDGQGRALSGHRTHAAYAGYAKRTLARALPATRKRYAHMKAALAPLALDATDTTGTGVQNDARKIVQNDNPTDKGALA